MNISPMIQPVSGAIYGIGQPTSQLLRTPPQPRNSAATWGAAVASTIGSAANAALGATQALGGGEFGALLTLQMQVQKEMAEVSMLSNISKSQHETEMAPIRNLRVG